MEVRVLGPLEVIGDDGRPIVIQGRKEQHLLTVLALRSPTVVSTDSLTDFLWGDDPPPSSHKALQTYVSHLRRALERGRVAGSPGLMLSTLGSGYALTASSLTVDAHRFGAGVTAGRLAWEQGDADRAHQILREALALWRGDVPAPLGDSVGAGAERSHLVEARLGALEIRIEAELALGRHQHLIGELEALVAAHPLRERLWSHLMLSLYRSHRQAEALRAYQRARGILTGELGLEPSPALRRLEAAVIAQDPSLDLPAPAARVAVPGNVPSPPPRESAEPGSAGDASRQQDDSGSRRARPAPLPAALGIAAGGVFVGRDDELSALRAAWARAEAGAGALVLVAGEPGIGKTSLAAHLAREVASTGAGLLYGRCDEELVVPFQPFVEALGAYVAAAPVAVAQELARTQGQELGRLLPALVRRVPDVPGPVPGEPETQRYRLFEAVVATFATISADGPTLLVLDDLHWADQATLLLLRHLARSLAGLRLLVVATFRDTDLDREGPAALLLADLRRSGPVERIGLAGLGQAEVAELLAASGGPAEDLDERWSRVIGAETRGNPLFVVEYARYRQETATGGPGDPPGERQGASDPLLPVGVREVVGGRLARLRPEARQVLAAAAVVGRDFDAQVVGRAARLEDDDVLDVLDEMTGAGLVVEGGAEASYSFSHAVVRRTIYEELSSARRSGLHRRVATAMEELHADHLDDHLGELAHHSLAGAGGGAGPAGTAHARRALDYARRAGDAALAGLAYEEAGRRYGQALEALDWLGPANETTRGSLLTSLGWALSRAGDLEGARAAFGKAAAVARQTGDSDLLVHAALGYAGPEPLHLAADREATELLGEALEVVGEDDSPARVLLLSGLVRYQALAAPTAQVRGTGRLALAAARRLGDPRTLATALSGHLFGLGGPDANQERLGLSAELAALAQVLGAPEPAMTALYHRIWALLERNDLLLAHEAMATFAERCGESGPPAAGWSAAQHEVFWSLARGEFGEAERLSAAAAELGRAAERYQLAAFCRTLQRGLIRWFQGELVEPDALSPATAPALAFLDLMPVMSVLMHQLGGRDDQARAELAVLTGEGAIAAIPHTMMWPATVSFLSGACGILGDREGAETLYRLLSPYAEWNCLVSGWAFLGAYSHHLGLLATACERFDDAEAHLAEAITRHQVMGARPWLAVSQWTLAVTLAARGGPGDAERAAGLAGEAERLAAELGVRILFGPGSNRPGIPAPAGKRR